jgi:hypothetical protein
MYVCHSLLLSLFALSLSTPVSYALTPTLFALPRMKLGHTHTCHKHFPRDRLLVRRRLPHRPLPLLPGVFGGVILTLYSVGAVPVDLSEILKSQCPSALYKATKYRTMENMETSGCPSRAARAESEPSSAVPRAAVPAVAETVRSYAHKFVRACALACGRAVRTHPRGAGTRVGSLAGRAS